MNQYKKISVIAICAILLSNNANALTLKTSKSDVYLDNKEISISGYNIDGSNYYKLRDLAYELKNTPSKFDVNWNETLGQIEIKTGISYNGTKETNKKSSSIKVTPAKAKIIIDGVPTSLNAYSVNGNTYYKLRDLGENLNFDVSWQPENSSIHIKSSDTSQAPKQNKGIYTVQKSNKSSSSLSEMTAKYSTNRWSDVIKNYIIENNNKTICAIEVSDDGYIYIDTYNVNDYSLISSKKIAFELPKFGGFFAGEKYNYIVFGQNNDSQDNSKEIIRVVQYDKDFNKLKSCSIKNAYTVSPFDAGSLRMAENGNTLTIHTARKRYLTPDGLNHQSQLTILLDTDKMEVKNNLGQFQDNHVSHSFNQFVKYDNNNLLLVDHGDAYPRSIVLNKSNGSKFEKIELFKIKGEIGANCTGITIGGFEISDNNYIVAINSIDHNKATEYTSFEIKGLDFDERDVILLVCDKNSKNVKQIKLTNYVNDKKLASTPYIVKINNNKFIVLWEEFLYNDSTVSNGVKYIQIDGNGNKIGQIEHMKNMNLSKDCNPIFINNNIVWFNNNQNSRIFYNIPIN